MQEKVYNKRLVYRVLRTFITIIIVIVAALGYLFLTTLKHIYQSELEKRGDALCNNLAFNSRYEMFIRDDEAMKSLLDGILLEEDIIFAYTIDDDQNILAFKSKGINEKDKKLIDNIIAKGNRINRTGKEYHSLKSDLNVLHIAKPVLLEPEESKSPDETVLYITTDQTLVSVDKTLLLGYVHVGMSLERLNQRISESERFILVLSIIFIVFFSFIAMLFSRTIVNPIIALVQATRNVSQGDLNYRAEVKSKDEIGLLTDSFNTMTEDLQRFQNEILVLNRNLEEKIKERTRELDQTNQELIRRNEDLQRMARELEQSNVKIREADRLKSEFLANMSHELRTPLNSIIGFSALSLKDPEIVGMPSIKDNFEEIHKNGKQLLDIINDILDLSKVEAGRMEFVNKKFEISIVIEDVIKTMKVIKEKKPVEFQSHIEENLPLVLGDPDRIRQVLLNVGSNAVKFTDKGSIEISANRKGNYIQISVKDTGVGIKEVDIPKVFESFRQIDGSSTRKEGGTGLGMTISKKFVELMGGTIWIESEFGRGTTVHFTIPIGPEVKHYLQEET
ncbi:MAG: HAMP domain-containing protein, partial [Candidatus Aureabacteria bacterium]|nr:HAMP domain-containing protein [Candidatus Auribacterota bacterium]